MQFLLILFIYVVGAVPTCLACIALSKRVEDKWSQQAFVFAFTVAWPLTWLLVVLIFVMLLIASLWILATAPLRRASS